jgi:hypothetical protein
MRLMSIILAPNIAGHYWITDQAAAQGLNMKGYDIHDALYPKNDRYQVED